MTKKRITAFLMTLVMLLTSVSVTMAENAETAPIAEAPVELIDTDEYYALDAMGFLGDELATTAKDALITRAQFTGYLFKLAGYTVTEHKTSEIPFLDVSLATPYYNEICTMYEMGIVNGTEPDRFSPDANVTYAQACKLIVDVLGYRNYTEIKYGTELSGYALMAGELDIDEGVKNVKWDTALTAENAITMLFNAGNTEVMAFSGTDKNGNPTYDTDGTTLFAKGNKIYVSKGTFQSDGICSVIGEEPVRGTTIIDGIRFVSADCDLSNLVGCKVEYFYRDTDVEKKLLWAMVDKRFSNVLEFKAEELAVTSSAYSLTNIVYYEADGDTESAKVNPMADVIYNYSRCGIPKLEDVKPLTGTIRLIDNDDDEIYDVVVVNEYKNMFIKQTSTDGHHLVGKYSQTIDIDKYEDVRIEKNGVEIGPEKIGHGVLVSYIENKEQTKIYIYVQSEKTKATLDATRLSRARTLYSIGGDEYRLSATYSKLLTDADVYAVTPVIGKEYTFYFDMAGEIAEVQQTTGDMQYALLMSTRAGEPYEDGEAYARLLLTDGSKVSGVIEKKVTVNGQRKSASEFLADTHLCDEYGEPKTQVVKVQFGDEGNLVKLDFANDIRNATDPVSGAKLYPYGFDEENFSLDYSDKSSSIRSQDGYILCNNRYSIKNDTVVFVKWNDGKEAEPYEVKSNSWIGTGSYYKEFYDVASDMTVSAVYREGLNRTSYWMGDGSMLVDEIDYIYENDQEIKRVKGYMGGTYMSVPENEPGVFPEDLKRGDLIRISHQNYKATRIVYEMKAEDFKNKTSRVLPETNGTYPTNTSSRAACFVPIYNVSAYGITIFTPDKWQSTCGEIMTAGKGTGGQVPVTVYDLKNDEMYIGDENDVFQIYSPNKKGELENADDNVMIYLRLRYMTAKEIILVRY